MLLDPLQARQVFAKALSQGWAVLAVNADSHAQLVDVLEAAKQANAPIIVETSLWQLEGRSFGAGDPTLGMTRYLADLAVLCEHERYRDVPVIFHTDHIKGPKTLPLLTQAIGGLPLRFRDQRIGLTPSTFSLDSSAMTAQENVDAIRTLAETALGHGLHITLEMEAGVDDGLTDPAITEQLIGGVEKTHPGVVWLYAPGIGTQHGFSDHGFPTFSPKTVEQHRLLCRQLTKRDIGIALHGSTGLSADQLRSGVQAGVVKVNWSSESLHLRASATRDYYVTNSDKLAKTHPEFKKTAMDNGATTFVSQRYIPVVIERIGWLGSAGKAATCLAGSGIAAARG